MSKKRIYYKLLIKEGRTSLIPHPTQVHYPAEKWAKPIVKGSKLMVFESEEKAVYCSMLSGDLLLVKCHIKRSSKQPRHIISVGSTFEENIPVFWEAVKKGDKRVNSNCFHVQFPGFQTKRKNDGTVFADEVFCLE